MVREYERLLDSSHGTCANVGTSPAVIYTGEASTTAYLRFLHIHSTSTSERTVSLHHWGASETICGDGNEFCAQTVYTDSDISATWEIPGKIVESGEKIVAKPDTAGAGYLNIDMAGGVKYED